MQQINLYLPEFRPNRQPLRAIHMLWGLAVFFILLLVVTFYTHYQSGRMAQQLVTERQLQQSLQAQLQTLIARKPVDASAGLDEKIGHFQQELQRRNQILAMIAHQDLGNNKGFSAQLNALAQASLSSISIETFSLQKGGSYAELTGKTRSADQIPLYLQKLRADPGFASVGFGVLNIERDKDSPGVLKFSVAKAADEKTKPTEGGR